MLSSSLIKVARHNLSNAAPYDEDDVNLRLSSQCAYRAMYHALCESIAEPYCGTHFSPAHPLLQRIYPTVDNISLRHADTNAFKAAFSQPIVDFISAMSTLKSKYDIAAHSAPFPILPKCIAKDIDTAESSIAAFLDIPLKERQKLALYLLINPR